MCYVQQQNTNQQETLHDFSFNFYLTLCSIGYFYKNNISK